MESNSFFFGDTEFKLVDNSLLLKKKSNRMLLKYFEIEEEFKSTLDMSIVENYESRISELEYELENTLEDKKEELQKSIDKLNDEMNSNPKVKSKLEHKAKVDGLILLELTDDKEFLKNWFKDVLIGDMSKLDFNSKDIEAFIMQVITFFLTYSRQSS